MYTAKNYQLIGDNKKMHSANRMPVAKLFLYSMLLLSMAFGMIEIGKSAGNSFFYKNESARE